MNIQNPSRRLGNLQSPNRQLGVTMIEVLVAVVVFAVGLSGTAMLVLNNVRTTASASTRTEAVILADQLVETMRANMVAYEAGTFAVTPATTTSNCTGVTCDATTLASYEATAWATRLAILLPAGQAFICVDSTPDDGQPTALSCDGAGTNVIKIFWNNSRFSKEKQEGATDWRRLVVPVVP